MQKTKYIMQFVDEEEQSEPIQQPQEENNTSACANGSAEANQASSTGSGSLPLEKAKVVHVLPQVQRIKYPVCQKGNFHEGELLNYVCLSTTNKDDVLGCAVCQEENKKSATWRPLKVVLHAALENFIKQSKTEFNSDEIIQYLEMEQAASEKEIDRMLSSFTEKVGQIKQSILSFFERMKDQVLSHSSANSAINDLFSNVYDFNDDLDLLKTSVQRLVNFMPQDDDEENVSELESKTIKANIENQFSEISKLISKGNEDLEQLVENQRKTIQDLVVQANIAGKSNVKFFFSNSIKHTQIQLLSKNIAKSLGSTPSYRFAIMEPVLPKNKTSKFAFKFKQATTNNWLAVGVCHKNIIVQKNYGFQFSNIGHGAYMISSNAGTWSTSQVASNNVVKAFQFTKNDVIFVEYDPLGKTVKFTKEKKPDQTYKLDITPIDNDPLYACILFYYVNDEVEYIHNYQQLTESTSTGQ